jgi:hypothetical protein
MSQDQLQSVHDDIAYMKDLAQSGRRAPLLGGSILISAGIVFGLASVVHWAIESGLVQASPQSLPLVWVGALLIFFAALVVQIRHRRGLPGAGTVANQATGAAWMGVGLAIFAMFVAVCILIWRTDSPVISTVLPSIIFALYGSGWAISATMSDQRWQWPLAIGCWVASPAIALLVGTPFLWLGYAAGLFLFAAIPGAILVRQENRGTV